MIPNRLREGFDGESIPRESGDDPYQKELEKKHGEYSPRERG